jgi:hypothetical protein
VLSYASAALLLVLLARAVWRNGLRTWLGSLGEALALEAEPHQHAHVHVHSVHSHPHAHAPHEHDH